MKRRMVLKRKMAWKVKWAMCKRDLDKTMREYFESVHDALAKGVV